MDKIKHEWKLTTKCNKCGLKRQKYYYPNGNITYFYTKDGINFLNKTPNCIT